MSVHCTHTRWTVNSFSVRFNGMQPATAAGEYCVTFNTVANTHMLSMML